MAVAASLARDAGPKGGTLWDLALDPSVPRPSVALGMVAVAAVGLAVEMVLTSAVRSERQRTPWSTALRDEFMEVAPLTYAVVGPGPLVALMAPSFGLASLPAALFPLAITYVAVARYAHNRMTYRQTIATLSQLTEAGGYTPHAHAERVADLSVRIGRVLGMPTARCARSSTPRSCTTSGRSPSASRSPAARPCSRRRATRPRSPWREPGSSAAPRGWTPSPATSRRRRRATGRSSSSARRCRSRAGSSRWPTPSTTSRAGAATPWRCGAAIERIHLGLGYEYDPEVVEALAVATADATVGRVGEREPVAR